MNDFERALIALIGEERFRRAQEARIGIAGAGGLGSNCAVNLVRSGFRRFVIVDFDLITAGNLNRQGYFARQVGMPKVEALRENLTAINPNLDLVLLQERITRQNVRHLFAETDAVIEALDAPSAKSMLVAELLPIIPLVVSVSGLAGWGTSDDLAVHRIKKNLVLIGDLVSDIAHNPPLAPRVALAAAKQADVILEHFWGAVRPS